MYAKLSILMNSSSHDLTALLAQIELQATSLDPVRIQKALQIAEEAYKDLPHWSGQTVMEHVAGVLETLLPFQPDEDAVISCILHHILVSEEWNLIKLEQEFGPKVRSLVSGVHLLSHVTLRGRRSSIEDLRLMLLTVSDDVRTVLIALCDHCHLLKRIDRLEPEDRRHLCLDILSLYAPVAARLGIYSLKQEMEARAFPVIYPNDAERVHEQVEALQERHGNFLETITEDATSFLLGRGMVAEVVSREKQPFSIFSKMRQKSLSHIENIYDLYAIRVMVPSIEECYQVLGHLHQYGRPVAHRFKDYISFPKPNGYQSLHTTLMGLPGAPEDVMIEVQIRTHEMHREAEYGIAAHWSYKTYGSTALALEHAQLHQMLASQEILEEESATPHLADHIFVLTPKGDVVELPEGATPLDFAFRVHTDVGLLFRGARVNGAMVSIDYELENGDIVEILKHSKPQPSPQWMQLLKMSSARSKLKQYFYAQDRPQLITQGKQLVNEFLKSFELPPLDPDLSLLRTCDDKTLTLQQREDVLMKIGQGAERASSLAERLPALKHIAQKTSKRQQSGSAPVPALRSTTVTVEGGVPMPTRFAKCCKPNKGEVSPIVGVVNRTGEVVIHRNTCGMLRNANPERQIGVSWE